MQGMRLNADKLLAFERGQGFITRGGGGGVEESMEEPGKEEYKFLNKA